MEKKQSSIQWLEKQLRGRYLLLDCESLLEQAKAMHKEEMKEMYLKGIKNYDPKFGGDNE